VTEAAARRNEAVVSPASASALDPGDAVEPGDDEEASGERERAPLDFTAVFEAELGYVWNALRRLGVPAQDLEDKTHDVFVAVYKRRAEFDDERPIKPWLFGFAFRVAAAHRRLARMRREVLDDGLDARGGASNGDDAEDALARGRDRELLMRALDDLDLDRRAIVVMHDLDGHAMPEIARALDVPLNTAYSRLRLARGELRAAVEKRKRGAR
jgi:RNA polymerase sigma-70 factor (ECF subfamily)